MRQILLIKIFFITSNFYGQNWQFNQINKHSKFKYEYNFHFDNLNDVSTYEMVKSEAKKKSKIEVKNNIGESLTFCYVKIIDLKNDSIIKLFTDNFGVVEIDFKPGNYKIEIEENGYDIFLLNFEIKQFEILNLEVKLGLGPEEEVYQINSMNKLDETEIQDIINCVKLNKKDFFKTCSKKNKYQISMHI